MAYKKYREMKVYEASGYQYKRTPSIVLERDSGCRSWDLTSESRLR